MTFPYGQDHTDVYGNPLAPRDDAPSSSWRPVDLSPVLAGDFEPPQPTVGRRDDGMGLFYLSRVHAVASESEAGKTMLLLVAARDELEDGNSVVYVDFEDDERGVVGRLLALGAKPAQVRERFGYLRPDEPITSLDNRTELVDALNSLRPTLVVIDGITEAMTLHGLEIKDNGDVARFGKLLPRPIAATGPAVVALDHVTKDREGRGRYAIGAVHKLNGVNGAAFTLENRTPFGIGRTGKSTVYVAKDRPGQLRRAALPAHDRLFWLATMEITSHDATFVESSLAAPVSEPDKPFRPTSLMAKVHAALNRAPAPLSQRDIEARVKARTVDVRAAVAALVDDGFVAVEPGPRGARLHRVVRPYGEESTDA